MIVNTIAIAGLAIATMEDDTSLRNFVADCPLYARDILDIEVKKGKQQNKWTQIDPFTKPFVKPQAGFVFSELQLLFYTRSVLDWDEFTKCVCRVWL